MVKLKDAKCPNCGANIQVNDKLENTICQYCGSQVVIEEAIEKYKLEISGKVEVDGIKGRNSKLEQAKKHIKIEEYDEAKKILVGIINEDSLDTEAYIELIKVNIELLKMSNFNENSSDLTDATNWNLYNSIIDNYNRVKKIDDGNNAEENFGKYKVDLQHYLELKDRIEKEEEELKEIVAKLNKYFEEMKRISPECQEVWLKEIVAKHFNVLERTVYHSYDKYRMGKINRITRDGIVECSFYRITAEYASNPSDVNLHSKNATPITLDEIRTKTDEIFGVTPVYIEESRKAANNEINRTNKKIDKENMVINARSKFAQVRIYIDYAIIAILLIMTLTVLIQDGIVGAIAMGIFLDSWVIYICIQKIVDHKFDLERNERYKKENSLKKREHV